MGRLVRILLAALGAGMVFLGGYYVAAVIRDGLSEYSAWILLIWAFPALWASTRAASLIAGSAGLAMAYTIRPNLLIGIMWMFLVAAVDHWKRHAKALLAAGLLALGIALLPLLHNIFYGGEWVLSTTSGGASVNLALLPSTWLAFLRGDPAAADLVREQMGMLFLVADSPQSQWPTLIVMGFFSLAWLAVIIRALLRRRWFDLLWLAAPVPFLAVHFIFNVSTYYPRHVVAGYLSLGITAVLALIKWTDASPPAGQGLR
jgi:hypothetical protein